jgi:NAD(P)-dependent dehydrogenase (short-subunit alcohol dehydrogenase family)
LRGKSAELAPAGIRINSTEPGPVMTPLMAAEETWQQADGDGALPIWLSAHQSRTTGLILTQPSDILETLIVVSD